MLTDSQIAHFKTFGFLVLKGYFSSAEMEEITQAFDHVLLEDRQGRPFDGEKRQGVLGCIEKHPALTRLVSDDRIYTLMEELIEKDFIWIGSDGNLYVGDTGWHPDNPNPSYMRIKVAFYLDKVQSNTGCLRVIPGSHLDPFHSLIKEIKPADITQFPFFPLESEPGDVVVFNQRVWHASFGGGVGRRMMTLNFGETPKNEKHIEEVVNMYERNIQFISELGRSLKNEMYGESFLGSDNERIKSMTSKLVELGLK